MDRRGAATEPAREAAPEPERPQDLLEKRRPRFEKLPAPYSLLRPDPTQSSLHGAWDVGSGLRLLVGWSRLNPGEWNDLSTVLKGSWV